MAWILVAMAALLTTEAATAAAPAQQQDELVWVPGWTGCRPCTCLHIPSPASPRPPPPPPSTPSDPRSHVTPGDGGGRAAWDWPPSSDDDSPASPPPSPPAPGQGAAPEPVVPVNCVTPLTAFLPCFDFLDGREESSPSPASNCCAGVRRFFKSTGGGETLRCLCPVILGQVNRFLPRPVDAARMLYLPVACGTGLPPQTMYVCHTGLTYAPWERSG